MQFPFQVLPDASELGNKYFLEGVLGTELLQLVVDLVVDEQPVVLERIRFDDFESVGFIELVDHLNSLKVQIHPRLGAAVCVVNVVALHACLHSEHLPEDGYHRVHPRGYH